MEYPTKGDGNLEDGSSLCEESALVTSNPRDAYPTPGLSQVYRDLSKA